MNEAHTEMWYPRPGEKSDSMTKEDAQAVADRSGRPVSWAGVKLDPADDRKYDAFKIEVEAFYKNLEE